MIIVKTTIIMDIIIIIIPQISTIRTKKPQAGATQIGPEIKFGKIYYRSVLISHYTGNKKSYNIQQCIQISVHFSYIIQQCIQISVHFSYIIQQCIQILTQFVCTISS